MAAIESILLLYQQLIGGSADLSGSNNTKTNNSKIINSKNFDGNYIHYGVREHGMAAAMNGLGSLWRINTLWWNVFNFF
jgi:transketolase